MHLRNIFRTISLGVLALLFCSATMACSCVRRTNADYYKLANVVVLGKVVSTNESEINSERKYGEKYVRRVTIRVKETFKGDVPRTLSLENNGGACSIYMQKDDQVVLFLDKTMLADSCDGSFPLESDERLRKRYKLDDQYILEYQAVTADRLTELRKAKPRSWWEF